MEVVICESAEQTAALAADAVVRLLTATPTAVLGLATGSSPLGLYDELARRHAEQGLSFSGARGFLLDEYLGLPIDHPQRYARVIDRELVGRVDFAPGAVSVADGSAVDVEQACTDYERAIADAGGVDLQVLGVGTDGHVAFNEPGSSLASRTRVKTLTRQTREDNARFFGGDVHAVPHHVITQGLGTILAARHLVVLASGSAKQDAVREMVEGPVSASWPATVLQHHPHVSVLLDTAAAAGLQRSEYYRQTWAAKPRWQAL